MVVRKHYAMSIDKQKKAGSILGSHPRASRSGRETAIWRFSHFRTLSCASDADTESDYPGYWLAVRGE